MHCNIDSNKDLLHFSELNVFFFGNFPIALYKPIRYILYIYNRYIGIVMKIPYTLRKNPLTVTVYQLN